MGTSKTLAKQVGFKLGKNDVCGLGWSIGFIIFTIILIVPSLICSMDNQCTMNYAIVLLSCAVAVWITFCGLAVARGKAIKDRASHMAGALSGGKQPDDDDVDYDIEDHEQERDALTH